MTAKRASEESWDIDLIQSRTKQSGWCNAKTTKLYDMMVEATKIDEDCSPRVDRAKT